MTPKEQKFIRFATIVIAILAAAMLFCIFCPSPNVHCPACNFTPTIEEAQQTNYCPKCGTCYNRNNRCSNCGKPSDTPYCPYCGYKNKEE